ncbi:MAG: ATP-binding protein [Verrucomicrobiae bacterium]
MKKSRLDALIFRHYARSALLSILTIEILLLAMYFGINAYNGRQTEETLKGEVQAVLPGLVSQSADSINANFALIARETKFFAAAHREVFAHPNTFEIPGEKPAFAKAANGSLHQTNLQDGSSLYISATGKFGEREMLIAEKSAALNPLYRHMVTDAPNVVASYINTPGEMNRLYPFMEKVWEQYPADLHMEDYNFYYLADAKHNPARQPVWTGVYLDPAGQGWMLSCIAPVYLGDTLEGVVGLDVTVEKIVSGILKKNLPWGASAFLADDKGMILAMSEDVENLFGLRELKSHVYSETISKEQLKPEEFSLFQTADPALVAGFRELYSSNAALREISARSEPVFVAQGLIPETGWHLFVVIRHSQVFGSVNRLARISQIIGYFAIAGMLAFYLAFFVFLRTRARRMAAEIARPVERLTLATAGIGTGSTSVPPSGIEEIDQLTDNFNTMSRELAQRAKDLVEAGVRSEMKEKEAELAYTRGLYESASGYLHNVGNAITRMESHLFDFDAVVKSTRQYPDVFRRLEAGGEGARETLRRFKEVLLDKTVPVIEATATEISRINTSIKQTISHQQAGFLAAGRLPTEKFSLSELLAGLCAQYQRDNISLQTDPDVVLRNHREPIRQGIENIIKNAVEATGASGKISVRCRRTPDGATVTVEDDGEGISSENLPGVMTAGFTTKPGGHGLGLHSFAVFLSASNGRLTVESRGRGKGALVKSEIKNAK